MAFRFVVLSALVALVNAGALPVTYKTNYAPLTISHDYAPISLHKEIAPITLQKEYAPISLHQEHEYEAPAHYSFSYDVHDTHTGDIKSQHESRQGDKVEGEYSLIEPDGTKRTVKYTADKHSGFNAIVHREPTKYHVPIKAVHAAPVAYVHSKEPITYTYHH